LIWKLNWLITCPSCPCSCILFCSPSVWSFWLWLYLVSSSSKPHWNTQRQFAVWWAFYMRIMNNAHLTIPLVWPRWREEINRATIRMAMAMAMCGFMRG
jgi:hypothetical protein